MSQRKKKRVQLIFGTFSMFQYASSTFPDVLLAHS